MTRDPLALELTMRRAALGRSQWSVAAEIGVRQSMVSDWESGRHVPSLPNARRWAEALGLRLVLAS